MATPPDHPDQPKVEKAAIIELHKKAAEAAKKLKGKHKTGGGKGVAGQKQGGAAGAKDRLATAISRAIGAMKNFGIVARVLAKTGRYAAAYHGRDAQGLYAWDADAGVWYPDDSRTRVQADIMALLESARTRLQRLVLRFSPALVREEGAAGRDLPYEFNKQIDVLLTITKEEFVKNVAGQLMTLCKNPEFSRYLFQREPRDQIVIPVRNGNIIVKPDDTITLEPITHQRWTLYRIPWDYDPAAPVPVEWFEACRQWLDDETVPAWQELWGLLITRITVSQIAVMLYGPAQNGKSTALRLLSALLGEHQISGQSLQNLTSNRFAVASLEGKLANISADLPSNRIKDTSIFKQITGEDPVELERKYRDSRLVLLWARMVFSANTIPATDDRSEGYFRRWVVFQFLNKFVDGSKYDEAMRKAEAAGHTYRVYRKVDGFEERFMDNPAAMSGLLNWALTGLLRLRKQKWDFTVSASMKAGKEEFRQESDLIRRFLGEFTRRVPHGKMVAGVAYKLFRLWWVATGISAHPPSSHIFGQALKVEFVRNKSRWALPSGKSIVADCYLGVDLNESAAMALIDDAASQHRREVQDALADLVGFRPGEESWGSWKSAEPRQGTYPYFYDPNRATDHDAHADYAERGVTAMDDEEDRF